MMIYDIRFTRRRVRRVRWREASCWIGGGSNWWMIGWSAVFAKARTHGSRMGKFIRLYPAIENSVRLNRTVFGRRIPSDIRLCPFHEPRASNSKHRSCEIIGPKWFNARPHPGPLPRGEGESVSAFCQHGGARLAMVQGFNARNPVSGNSCGRPPLAHGC